MGNPFPVAIIDESGDARLVGLADFTDPGNQPGSAGPLIVVTFAANTPTGLAIVPQLVPNALVGGPSFGGIAAGAEIVHPPALFAMGAVVAGTGVVVNTSGVVPSTPDALDLTLRGYVIGQTGVDVATIAASGQVANPVTDTALTLDLSGSTWTIVSGADLSDGGGGTLNSAGGGIFTCGFACSVGWD